MKFGTAGILASTFTAAILSGCGAKEKVEDAFDRDFDLVGTWRSACSEVSVVDVLPNATRAYDFRTGGSFSRTEKFYTDDRCEVGDEAFIFDVKGSYETKGPSDENKDIETINYKVDHVYVTVKSEAAAEALAVAELCGIDNWDERVNKRVEITDKSCAGFNIQKGDKIFDVYDVQKDKMYTGKALSFSLRDEADDRPSEVDTDVEFKKQ